MSIRAQRLVATFALLIAVAANAAVAELPPTGIQWHSDLDQARGEAAQQQKLMVIHFYTSSCPPCAILDNTVFNQPSVAKAIHDMYVPVKLNASDFPATAERFGITRVPMEVVITPEGRVLDKFVPPASPMAYTSKLGELAKGYVHSTQRDFNKSPMSSPSTQPLNSSYGNLSIPPQNPLDAPGQPSAPTGLTVNPFAASAQGSTVAKPAAPTTTAQATPPQPPANAAPVQAVITENQYAAAAAPATGAQTSEGQFDPSKIVLPPGAPPLGFQGYCPVTMKESLATPEGGKWQPGKVEWGAIHRGRTYLFASEQLRDKFLTNPDAYAPALAGADPVLAIDQKKTEEGLRKFGVEYAGQFYLFSSQETLRQFWNQPERYATEVRQAMGMPPQRVLR